MTPFVRRRVLAIVSLATAALLAAGPASAASYTHEDPAGDVQRTTNGGAPAAAPGNRSADLTAITTRYLAYRVVLTAQVRELQTTRFQLEWRIRTPRYDFEIDWVKLPGVSEFGLRYRGSTVTCNIGRSLDPVTDLIKVSVPRSCLSSPESVRTGLWLMTQSADESTYYMDDAQRKGAQNRANIFLGPKVLHA